MLFAGVINKNIYSFEFLDNLLYCLLTKFPVANISFYGKAFSPFPFYQFFRFRCIIILFKINESNISSFACKMDGNRPTNTGISTGYQSYFVN